MSVNTSTQQASETASADTARTASRNWDHHWLALGKGRSRSLFGWGSSLVRHLIFQPAVRFFLDKYFPAEGVFVEMGCGTGESSATVPRRNRKFVGLDFSTVALGQAQSTGCFDSLLCADLFQLPLQSHSIDGIWNLGVMEHFERAALTKSLAEFRRVLKPGGVIALFWPAEANLSRWILGPIEVLRSTVTGRTFHFFPDEVSRLKSRQQASEILCEAGFAILDIDFSPRTAFIHMVVVARSSHA